ncbi:hypothetical protein KM043_003732 [Ampulex compressa]|nr:hypothetical protein KM043_003732 [Ampulex compressa]
MGVSLPEVHVICERAISYLVVPLEWLISLRGPSDLSLPSGWTPKKIVAPRENGVVEPPRAERDPGIVVPHPAVSSNSRRADGTRSARIFIEPEVFLEKEKNELVSRGYDVSRDYKENRLFFKRNTSTETNAMVDTTWKTN